LGEIPLPFHSAKSKGDAKASPFGIEEVLNSKHQIPSARLRRELKRTLRTGLNKNQMPKINVVAGFIPALLVGTMWAGTRPAPTTLTNAK